MPRRLVRRPCPVRHPAPRRALPSSYPLSTHRSQSIHRNVCLLIRKVAYSTSFRDDGYAQRVTSAGCAGPRSRARSLKPARHPPRSGTGSTTGKGALRYPCEARPAPRQQNSAPLAQSAERLHGKEKVNSSILLRGSRSQARKTPLHQAQGRWGGVLAAGGKVAGRLSVPARPGRAEILQVSRSGSVAGLRGRHPAGDLGS
jgi:hypothetical protein